MDSVYTHRLSTGKHALKRINKGVSPLSTAFHMEKMGKQEVWNPVFCGKVENNGYQQMLFHHCIHMKSMINKGYEKLFYSFHIWWKTMICILVEESWKISCIGINS
ncbi:MAG: hypothetical protein ACLTDX_23725 [[Clostridium] innocuum]